MKRTSCAPDQNDALGRVEEAGEKTDNGNGPQFATVFGTTVNNFYNPKVIDDANLYTWITNATGQRTEVTHTYYDAPNATITTALPNNFTQENLRKRVSCVVYEEVWDNNDATYDHATHYTYDIHGNVNTLLQDNPNTGVAGQEFKRLDYDYDLISGNVNEVVYQEGELDMMIHRYEYDGDNRIASVETSTDGVFFDNDAKYFYYAHGPLARTELGENQVQGLDYVYTLQGWIKGVNSNTLDSTRDIGQDGNRALVANPNGYFAKDVFGYTLNYFAPTTTPQSSGDYTPINSTVWQTANRFEADKTGSDLLANREDFFNGNISAMVTTITNPTTGEALPQGMAYSYDQLNRLLSAKAFTNLDPITNTWQSGSTYSNSYYNAFTYDANGNILTQKRHDQAGNQIEDLSYQYNRNGVGQMLQNRLYHVNDNVTTIITEDIEDQGVFNSNNSTMNSANNYGYDREGRLIRDDAEEIAQITWTVTGKVKEVIRTSGSAKKNLKFRYDAMGQRIAKEVYDANNNWEKTTFYVRDPQGNVMAIYEKKNDAQQLLSYKITERYIYGSSTVGLVTSEVEMIGTNTSSTVDFMHEVGKKQFYESNHLSNLLTAVSDKIIAHDWNADQVVDYFRAEILCATDYSGFGAKLTERTFEILKPRHDFNGKETDDETGIQDYGMRMYNPLLGRFLSVDAIHKKYPELSVYQFASNTPIQAIDIDGMEALVTYITNNPDGSTKMVVMADETVLNNASVPMQNRIVVDGTYLTTSYGSMGVPYLDKNMQNVRMTDGGLLAYDTPDPEGNLYTVTTLTGARTVDDGSGSPPSYEISFLATWETTEGTGPIVVNVPFDGSTGAGTPSVPVNLNVPAIADPGSVNLLVTMNDMTVPNTTSINVTTPGTGTPPGPGTTTTSTIVGNGTSTTYNQNVTAAPGDTINITTPNAPAGDAFTLMGNLQYTVTR